MAATEDKSIDTVDVAVSIDNAKVLGIDANGGTKLFPLSSIVRSEKPIATPATVPPGQRFAGETWPISTAHLDAAYTGFGGITVTSKVAEKYTTNNRFVWNNGAWEWQKELVESLGVEDLKAVKDNFETSITRVYLFNGSTDTELNQYIYGGAAPNIWMTGGGRCCIVPVTAGEVIRISGRDTMTSTKSIVWLTSNYHVIGEAPTFLTGSFSTSRLIGDGDYTVPSGAKFLYVFFDIPKSNVKVENVSSVKEKFILKDDVIQPATFQKILQALQPANIDVNAEGGSGKVAAADQLKAVKDKFESSPSTLFDGSKDIWLSTYIYGGGTEADKLWRDDVSSNISVIVPVTAGETIEISGRELTATKRNFWLTGTNSILGTKPDFRGGTSASATFLSDGQFVVPVDVTHLYVYAQTSSRLTVKIRNLTVRDLKLKDESLPDKIIQDISALQEQVGVVSNPGKLIIPTFVDVLINTDCNLYFDAITTIPDQLLGFNLISGLSTSGLVLRRERSLKFKATDQQTNKLVSLYIRRPDWTILDAKNFNIRTIPVTGLSGTVNLMILGDSQAYNGASFIYAKLADYTDITINRIGTVTSGGVKHEGRGAWEISDYLTNSTRGGFENPFFVNGELDFNQYLANTGQATPDIVCVSIGGNDVGLGGTGIVTDSAIEAVIVKIKTFITAMSTAWPNTTIVLQTITPGGIRFNLSYNTGEYYKYNRMRASLRYVEEFDNGKFNPKVTVCCAGSWVDRENGYAYTLQQSADRIPDVQERVYSDPAHSNSDGYRQMADALASKIRAIKSGLL